MTNPVSSQAMSAMTAYGARQQAGAHNVANMNTQGFEPSRVTLAEKSDQGGVRVQETRTEAASSPSEPQDRVTLSSQATETGGQGQAPEEASQTEVAEEMVQMEENSQAYSANSSVVQAQQQMQGSLVNQMV